MTLIEENGLPDANTRLICHSFSDIRIPRIPFLYAVDHFRLPLNISNASMISFTFATLRSRNDRDPESLMLLLFHSAPNKSIPADTPFFTKRINAPGTPPAWPTASLSQITNIEINISQGEKSTEDTNIIFDLDNTSLFPRDTLLWAGFYATGPRNHTRRPEAENCMYWVVSGTNVSESSTSFYYTDTNHLLAIGVDRWHNASVTLRAYNYRNSSARRMAWSVRVWRQEDEGFITYLKHLGTTETVIVVLSSIVGAIVICVCSCWCLRKCRLCLRRRRERALYESKKEDPGKRVENLSASFYSPVYDKQNENNDNKGESLHAVWSSNEDTSHTTVESIKFDDFQQNETNKVSAANRYINGLKKNNKGTTFI